MIQCAEIPKLHSLLLGLLSGFTEEFFTLSYDQPFRISERLSFEAGLNTVVTV